MYRQFFGLRKSPFNLTPDPEFLYLTPQHREALASFTYGILAGKGFVVLTGMAGSGKTTLLRQMLHHLPASSIQTSVIVNPTLTPAEFLEAAMLDFGFDEIPASKALRIDALQSFLLKGRQEGRTSALIVDEAHKLSLELLEEVRLLGNFESTSEKLLQVVLVGQPELDELLNSEGLRQFKQRIALRAAIGPLQAEEVGRYIQHRWRIAGGAAAPFTAGALGAITQTSEGVPRLINVICDNALIEAYGEESATVESRHVISACRDLHLTAPEAPSAPEPPAATPEPTALAPEPSAPMPEPTALMSEPMAPAPVWPPDVPTMRTLERYIRKPARPSFLGRLRNRFRAVDRVEAA